jgi:hypothetical protein
MARVLCGVDTLSGQDAPDDTVVSQRDFSRGAEKFATAGDAATALKMVTTAPLPVQVVVLSKPFVSSQR